MLVKFDPVKLSLEENAFVFENVGKPPVVGLQNRPAHVTEAAVRPVIEGVYELIELAKHDPTFQWAGVEAVQSAITTYLTQAAAWERNKKRGAPRFPSMYSFDGKGRAHWQGPGSDCGQVKTYFDSQGERHEFAIDLVPTEANKMWVPEWINPATKAPAKALVVNNDLSRIECFCGHTERFKEGSRASYNAARARISRHLRRAAEKVEEHRELHTAEFGA